MIEYITRAGETIEKIALRFFGDLLHTESLARVNGIDSKQPLANGTKLKIPPKIHSVEKRARDGGKIVIDVKVTRRSCFEGSVGAKGENKPEDVKRIKERLHELWYPLNCIDENCGEDTIKAIQLFQVLNCVLKRNYYTFDGRVDKNGATEKRLFSSDAQKYKDIEKGSIKGWQAGPKSHKTDADNGDDQKVKDIWQKIEDVWNAVSPYLPEGAELSSGYRDIESQRKQLYNKYNFFDVEIKKKYGEDTWNENIKKIGTEMSNEQQTKFDQELHDQIKGIGKGKEVALPGKSLHQKGRAIDIGGSAQRIDTIRALGYYMLKVSNNNVSAINNESNCIHFEFL